jgi:hypothetical protein
LENITTSQDSTRDVIIHLHETLQTTVAPLSAINDNLVHLHQKIDSLVENTLDERLPSGTHILNAGHINDRTGLANAGEPDDADHTSWAAPDFPPDDDAATVTTPAARVATISPPSPYGTPYISNRGSRGAPTPTSRYPLPSPLRSSSGGMSRALPGSAPSFHELAQSGAINWMLTDKGPYLGGVQKTFKTISISLVTDGFDDFFHFYNGIITQLSPSGFHRRLLPSLDRIAPDVDLCRSPVKASCMPLSGAHCLAEWSQAAYWDEQHEHLSQLLYLTLTSKDVIKITAPITLGIINRHSQYSNGFGVLQALIRRHHPRVTLSMAPTFVQCLTLRPTLQLAKGLHPAYLSLFERWMDRMRLNLEYEIMHRPSQFSIWFIHGLSVPLRAQLKSQELILMRFQVHHRATPLEPELPPETEVAELGQLLDVFAPETFPVEQLVTSSVTTAGITTDLVPIGREDTSETYYEHYVAAFGGPTRQPGSRSAQPSVPCGNHPCQGRSHPPDLCCICYAPHPWAKCWHMNGLPEHEDTRCKEYKAMADSGDTNPPLPSDAKRGVSGWHSGARCDF